jgi:hypothetical protein
MTGIVLYVKLAFATGVVLAPGWLVARALGIRSVGASLAWSLALIFGGLAVTFALQASLTLTVALLAVAAIAGAGVLVARGWAPAVSVPKRWWAMGGGVLVGIALWRVAGAVQGDGLFHLARVRKLRAFDELSLDGVSEFADGGLHPGYAFPLWHGFLALIAMIARTDPEQVVRHLPSLLAPLAVVIAYEVGWAMFRRTWAAGAVAAAQVALVCFAPGHGGAYALLSLPETAARQLLVPVALALALEAMEAPSRRLFASTAAGSLALAVVHPTYALFLWIPFIGFLIVRALWTRAEVGAGYVALGALILPASFFMLWLLPVVNQTSSVTPSDEEVRRAFDQYAGQLNVRSETLYSLAAEVFTRAGAVTVAALLLLPLAALASRRRWAAYVTGGSLAVFAVMLVPYFFTVLSELVSISQARRAAGFLPFAFAFVGGIGVLSRIIGPILPPIALVAGTLFQLAYPGDFTYVLDKGGPPWVVWFAVVGATAGLVVGFVRRGAPYEAMGGIAAAMFLLPVVAIGLARWDPVSTSSAGALSPGLVEAVRTQVPNGAVVYSDQETSYRLAAYAPVYVAVAPPGNVADTEANTPYERAEDARTFMRTGDLTIPARYGADYLVLNTARRPQPFDLPELYRDDSFVLYRLRKI